MANFAPGQSWHGLIYSDPGAGKSCFAATMPKPLKVFMFDPFGKDVPYLAQGDAGPLHKLDDGTYLRYVTQAGIPDKLVVELEYFFDLSPALLGERGQPLSAYERFQASLLDHVARGWEGYESIVLDSLTNFTASVVRVNQYKLNPTSRSGAQAHGIQWYGAASLAVQNDVCATLAWCPRHVAVLCHVNNQKQDARGYNVYAVEAPGQLARSIAKDWPEQYFLCTTRNAKGHVQRGFQTENDGVYMAQTHLDVPSGVAPEWRALWQR